jgi:HSP20 family protein
LAQLLRGFSFSAFSAFLLTIWGKISFFKTFETALLLPSRGYLTLKDCVGVEKMSIVRWNPWREFDDIFTNMAALPNENLSRSEWLPAVDISETEADYKIDVEIPAVARDDINVSVADGVLTVTGERKVEKDTDGKTHRVERQYGRFSRSFRLPENVDEEHIGATSKDGVLYLVVAKREEEGPRSIEVAVH